MPADTEAGPAGRYPLRRDRFVLEASVRPLLRGRHHAVAGFLDLDTDELFLELAADSLRTNLPLPRRGLPRKGELCFSSTELTIEHDGTVEAGGHLAAGDRGGPLHLSGRVVRADAASVVVWVRGRLRAVRFELAAEFSR